MAGTNAVAAKRALIAALAGEFSGTDVQVSYSQSPTPLREVIYGGAIEGDHAPMAFRSGGGRLPREESAVFSLHLRVLIPGGTQEDAETRVAEIGETVEHYLALNPRSGPDGTLFIRVTDFQLDSFPDDDAAVGLLVYRVAVQSHLR